MILFKLSASCLILTFVFYLGVAVWAFGFGHSHDDLTPRLLLILNGGFWGPLVLAVLFGLLGVVWRR